MSLKCEEIQVEAIFHLDVYYFLALGTTDLLPPPRVGRGLWVHLCDPSLVGCINGWPPLCLRDLNMQPPIHFHGLVVGWTWLMENSYLCLCLASLELPWLPYAEAMYVQPHHSDSGQPRYGRHFQWRFCSVEGSVEIESCPSIPGTEGGLGLV